MLGRKTAGRSSGRKQAGSKQEDRAPRSERLSLNLLGALLMMEIGLSVYLLLGVWPAATKVPAVAVTTTPTTTIAPTPTTSTPPLTPKPATTTSTLASGATTSTSPLVSQSVVSGQTTSSNNLPNVSIFGVTWHQPDPDLLYIVVVLLLGALGSSVHALTSFATYKGNRTLYSQWTWWYLMRLPAGSAIALIFYFAIRAGLVSVNTSTGSVSPYGIGAMAALSGLFSKQAIDKLREIFDSLFRTQQGDAQRADKVEGTFSLSGIDPDRLPVGSTNLTAHLSGKGFDQGLGATVNRAIRHITVLDPQHADLLLLAEDVANPAMIAVDVTMTTPAGQASGQQRIRIYPRVDSLDFQTDSGNMLLLVKGAGFTDQSVARIDDTDTTVTARNATSLTLPLRPGQLQNGSHVLVVVNPDDQGGNSNEKQIPTPPTQEPTLAPPDQASPTEGEAETTTA